MSSLAFDRLPPTLRPLSRRAVTLLIVLLGITLLMSGLTAMEGAYYRSSRGEPIEWAPLFGMRLLDWSTCALFAPPLYLLICALLKNERSWGLSAFSLLLASVAATAGKYVVHTPIAGYFDPGAYRTVGEAIHADFLGKLLFFWAVIGILYAVALYGRSRSERPLGGVERRDGVAPLDRLAVPEERGVGFINASDIDWVEAQGNYSQVHVGTRRYLIRKTMAWFETRLCRRQFARVHRSAIVNVERVCGIRPVGRGFRLILIGGEQVIASRVAAKQLKGRMEL